VRLCLFRPLDRDVRGWVGAIEGDRVVHLAAQSLASYFTGGGSAREHDEYALEDVRFLAPVPRPASVRDFYAFEDHIRNAARVLDRPGVPDEWYELPVFYFSNPAAIYGPEDEIPPPPSPYSRDGYARRLVLTAWVGMVLPPVWFVALYFLMNALFGEGELTGRGRFCLILAAVVMLIGLPMAYIFLQMLRYGL